MGNMMAPPGGCVAANHIVGVSRMVQPPSAYIEGYRKARQIDPHLADTYVRHTMTADPLADAAIASLDDHDPVSRRRIINACMNNDKVAMREAPAPLRDFFESLNPPAGMFDPAKAAPGARAFHEYSDVFFVGLVCESLIAGFSTAVSKTFYATERMAGNPRRVQQNTRHLIEITLPGGLDRHGDGWKLSVRIRLIHAQVRKLILQENNWEVAADGVPLHASHMALAATGFSAINLQAVKKMGVHLTTEERAGFMHIWRYVTWLLGVPDDLLTSFDSEEAAIHLKDVAYICEPHPDVEARSMAHDMINGVPDLVGVKNENPAERKKFVNALFKVSRALIGNELADALEYPKQSTFGILAILRMQRRMQLLRSKVLPGTTPFAADNFMGLMQRSVYDEIGISYDMPDAVRDSDSSRW